MTYIMPLRLLALVFIYAHIFAPFLSTLWCHFAIICYCIIFCRLLFQDSGWQICLWG